MLRRDFPIFRHHPDLVYLDTTASAQKPQYVIDAMKDFMECKYANIHRGSYELSEMAETVYEKSKKITAGILHARDASEIFYTYNATYGMNLIAESLALSGILQSGDTILTTAIEHHANLVPWFIAASRCKASVSVIPLGKNSVFDYIGFERALSKEVKVVTVTAASNVTGELIDLARIRAIIDKKYEKESAPLFIVDASQLIPHARIDVQALDIDFLVFTGHKVMADTGLGIVYGKKSHLQKLTPSFGGGGAINTVTKNGFVPAGLPYRWEPGTPHIIGAASLLAAFEYIDSIGGYEKIKAIENDLIDYTWQKLEGFTPYHDGRARLIGGKQNTPRIGVWSFFTPEVHVNDLAEIFAEHHIAVRSGHHCAEPLHSENDIPASIRMSFGIYTTRDDIDRFFEVFEKVLTESVGITSF